MAANAADTILLAVAALATSSTKDIEMPDPGCLLQMGLDSKDISPAICHLILDTATDLEHWPPQQPGRAASLARQHAAAVLLRCCQAQPRLAAKVAAAFHLTADDLSVAQQAELLDGISALLDANATSAAGVSLLLHFRPLLRHFHLEALLEDLVLSSQEAVAIRLARELGSREMQVHGGGGPRGRAAPLGDRVQ